MGNITRKAMLLRQKVKDAGDSMVRTGKALTAGLTLPIAGFGIAALKASANMETITAKFTTIFHSSKKAKEFVQKLIDFTAKTPFRIQGMAGAAIQLINFGVSGKNVLKVLKQLGDIAAGAKYGDIETLAQIYGIVHQTGKLNTRELRQMMHQGIGMTDVLGKIAKEHGHILKNVLKQAEAGYINAKVYDELLDKLTKGSGVFANAMLILMGTLKGLTSTLLDNVTLTLAPIGDLIVDALDLKTNMFNLINALGRIRKSVVVFEKTHHTLAKILVYVGLIIAAIGPLFVTMGVLTLAISAAFAPITLAVIAVIALTAAFVGLYMRSKDFRDVVNQLYAISKAIWPFWSFIIKGLLEGLGDALYLIGQMLTKLNVYYWIAKAIYAIFHKKHHAVNQQTGTQTVMHQTMMHNMMGAFSLKPQTVTSKMHISLNDPGKMVNNITTKGMQHTYFDLGNNMAFSRM
ncbi:MAG: tape measure protein [Candidatus Pacearchaeota archaeon]